MLDDRNPLSLHALKIDEFKNRNAEWTQKRVTAVKVQREFAELLTDELHDPASNAQLKPKRDRVSTEKLKTKKAKDLPKLTSGTREAAIVKSDGKLRSRINDQGANEDKADDDDDMDELLASGVLAQAPTQVAASVARQAQAAANQVGHSKSVATAFPATVAAVAVRLAVDDELEQVKPMANKRKTQGETLAELDICQQSQHKHITTSTTAVDDRVCVHDAAARKKPKR